MATRELLKGIVTDDSRNREFLDDMTPEQWHAGVKRTLDLLAEPPCSTSKAILDAIAASGKRVTIIPSAKRAIAVGASKEFGNAGARPEVSERAAGKGRPTEDDPPLTGIGGGSNSVLEFVAQDWEAAGSGAFPYKKGHNPFAYLTDVVNDSTQKQNLVAMPQFNSDVAAGRLRPLTQLERLEARASGHPDLASTQAAKRLLAKRFAAGPSGEANEGPPGLGEQFARRPRRPQSRPIRGNNAQSHPPAGPGGAGRSSQWYPPGGYKWFAPGFLSI